MIGSLLPSTLLLPLDQSLLVLICFGVMDDCKYLCRNVKFIGQFNYE